MEDTEQKSPEHLMAIDVPESKQSRGNTVTVKSANFVSAEASCFLPHRSKKRSFLM